jgi:23S rRNA (cytidine1920-2'-O)/16S rRNA (cytidine1409-2'-O)-methyltransferase
MSNDRLRLDEALVARGLYASRARARDAILRGTVAVDGVAAVKPSQSVSAASTVTLNDTAQPYVARSALKLVHALDHFAVDVAGRSCLDLGASTGGFTQVLLERGASRVAAVDVGHGQLAPVLVRDPRVSVSEGLNARDLRDADVLPGTTLIVCDVSFISLTLALPSALALVPAGSFLVALIKPQFEVGRGNLGKNGIVSDPALHQSACAKIADFLDEQGWRVKGVIPSPLLGGDGNREFLIAAVKA